MVMTLFNREVDIIQQRHALMFPDEHRQYIHMRQEDGGWKLSFREGNKIHRVICLEIQMSFRLIFAGKVITEIYE